MSGYGAVTNQNHLPLPAKDANGVDLEDLALFTALSGALKEMNGDREVPLPLLRYQAQTLAAINPSLLMPNPGYSCPSPAQSDMSVEFSAYLVDDAEIYESKPSVENTLTATLDTAPVNAVQTPVLVNDVQAPVPATAQTPVPATVQTSGPVNAVHTAAPVAAQTPAAQTPVLSMPALAASLASITGFAAPATEVVPQACIPSTPGLVSAPAAQVPQAFVSSTPAPMAASGLAPVVPNYICAATGQPVYIAPDGSKWYLSQTTENATVQSMQATAAVGTPGVSAPGVAPHVPLAQIPPNAAMPMNAPVPLDNAQSSAHVPNDAPAQSSVQNDVTVAFAHGFSHNFPLDASAFDPTAYSQIPGLTRLVSSMPLNMLNLAAKHTELANNPVQDLVNLTHEDLVAFMKSGHTDCLQYSSLAAAVADHARNQEPSADPTIPRSDAAKKVYVMLLCQALQTTQFFTDGPKSVKAFTNAGFTPKLVELRAWEMVVSLR